MQTDLDQYLKDIYFCWDKIIASPTIAPFHGMGFSYTPQKPRAPFFITNDDSTFEYNKFVSFLCLILYPVYDTSFLIKTLCLKLIASSKETQNNTNKQKNSNWW